MNFLYFIGQQWVTGLPLNQSLQKKWNHVIDHVPIHVSKAAEGRKEPWTQDWEKQVSRE